MADLSKRIVYQVSGMDQVTIRRNLVYKRDDDVELHMDVYTPPNVKEGAHRPAVFFVHGGPIPSEMQPPKEWGVYLSYGELMAASGLVGVTFNHRFYSPALIEQSVSDISAAIAAVRAQADSLHIDPERLCLWAFSGGGLLLSWVLRERPAYVRCIAAYYALLDLRHITPPTEDAASAERAQKFSPIVYLKDRAAGLPMFIARGGLDRPGLNQSIDRFVQEALAANALINVANHPQGQHGFDFLDDDVRSREIIASTVEFIKTHLQNDERSGQG